MLTGFTRDSYTQVRQKLISADTYYIECYSDETPTEMALVPCESSYVSLCYIHDRECIISFHVDDTEKYCKMFGLVLFKTYYINED